MSVGIGSPTRSRHETLSGTGQQRDSERATTPGSQNIKPARQRQAISASAQIEHKKKGGSGFSISPSPSTDQWVPPTHKAMMASIEVQPPAASARMVLRRGGGIAGSALKGRFEWLPGELSREYAVDRGVGGGGNGGCSTAATAAPG